MSCPKCGKVIADGSRFCPACGQALPTKTAPAGSRRGIGLAIVLGGAVLLLALLLVLVFAVLVPALQGGPGQIVFINDRDNNITLIHPDSKETQKLTDDGDEMTYLYPQWSPDRRWVAAMQYDPDRRECSLWLMRPGDKKATTAAIDVEQTGYYYCPRFLWAPNSQAVAVMGRDDRGDWWLVIGDLAGKVREIELDVSGVNQFDWSPDSRQLALTATGTNNRSQVIMVDVAKETAEVIAEERTDRFTSLAWMPDGRLLLVTLMRSRGWEFHTLRPDGSDLQELELEKQDAYVAAPLFSAKGNRLAYASSRSGDSGSWQIYAAQSDGRSPQAVGKGTPAAWSPDGARLLYRDANGVYRLYDVRAQESLYVTGERDTKRGFQACAFAPDGKRLVCTADRIYICDPQEGGDTRLANGTQPNW